MLLASHLLLHTSMEVIICRLNYIYQGVHITYIKEQGIQRHKIICTLLRLKERIYITYNKVYITYIKEQGIQRHKKICTLLRLKERIYNLYHV